MLTFCLARLSPGCTAHCWHIWTAHLREKKSQIEKEKKIPFCLLLLSRELRASKEWKGPRPNSVEKSAQDRRVTSPLFVREGGVYFGFQQDTIYIYSALKWRWIYS